MGEPLFSFPVASIRPKPGTDPQDVEMPGPGLYEAEYAIPGWVAQALQGLGADELDINTEFTVPFVNGMDLEHLRTTWRGERIIIRARLVAKDLGSQSPMTQNTATVGRMAVTVFRHKNFGLVVKLGIVSAIIRGLVVVRKYFEVGSGQALAIGGGVALAGLGVAKIRGG